MNFSLPSFLARAACGLALTFSVNSLAFAAEPTARVEAMSSNAGEFSTIPNGDALYGFWAQVQRANWFVTNGRGAQNGKTNLKTGVAKTVSLTRYELALETGRAYFALSARAQTDTKWMLPNTQRASVRALRELLNGLRPELRRLQVDVNGAVALCDSLLQPLLASPSPVMASSEPAVNSTRSGVTSSRNVASLIPGDATGLRVPLSQRLRVYAALSSLEREASDPFGGSPRATGLTVRQGGISSRATGGAAYDVADWLSVRAGFENARSVAQNASALLQSNSTLNSGALGNMQSERAIGGGVDIELWRGLQLSGDVARVAATNFLDNKRTAGTRFAGGVGVSAWQNRLALSMNLSRLVPEDSAVLSSSVAGLNVALGSDRVKLNFLYQQLFGPEVRARGDRAFATGININF